MGKVEKLTPEEYQKGKTLSIWFELLSFDKDILDSFNEEGCLTKGTFDKHKFKNELKRILNE